MLEQERNNAMRQEQAETAQRSEREAAKLRAQHEQQKREYEAKKNALVQQQHASTSATLGPGRKQNWGTQLIGEYESIKPVSPPRKFFGFGGSSK